MRLVVTRLLAKACSCHVEDELANAVTHALGVALALAGMAVLVTVASLHRSPRQIVSYSIYGVTLVLLYAVSTAYHGVRVARAKQILRILDHAAIYMLIAGTYTPFSMISLRGACVREEALPWMHSFTHEVRTAPRLNS